MVASYQNQFFCIKILGDSNLVKGGRTMKNYNKPNIYFIELRVEESLAGIGSTTVILGNNSSIAEQMFPDNLVSFWMKFLRK